MFTIKGYDMNQDLCLYELSNWSDSEYLTANNAFDAIQIYAKMFGEEAAGMIENVCKIPRDQELTFDGITRTAEAWVQHDPKLFMTTAR